MPLDTEDMQRIMVEVDLGVPAAESKVPRSDDADAYRDKMTKQIADQKAAGHMLDFTPEFPDL